MIDAAEAQANVQRERKLESGHTQDQVRRKRQGPGKAGTALTGSGSQQRGRSQDLRTQQPQDPGIPKPGRTALCIHFAMFCFFFFNLNYYLLNIYL